MPSPFPRPTFKRISSIWRTISAPLIYIRRCLRLNAPSKVRVLAEMSSEVARCNSVLQRWTCNCHSFCFSVVAWTASASGKGNQITGILGISCPSTRVARVLNEALTVTISVAGGLAIFRNTDQSIPPDSITLPPQSDYGILLPQVVCRHWSQCWFAGGY